MSNSHHAFLGCSTYTKTQIEWGDHLQSISQTIGFSGSETPTSCSSDAGNHWWNWDPIVQPPWWRELQEINHKAALQEPVQVKKKLPFHQGCHVSVLFQNLAQRFWNNMGQLWNMFSLCAASGDAVKKLPPGRPLQGCADSHHWLSAAGLQFTAENMFNDVAIALVGTVPVPGE